MDRCTLTTDDGVRLEAEVEVPDRPRAAIVLAHPHPLYGGSMRGGVPALLFERLPDVGIAALRFNFRGVEGSEGAHDAGVGERLDVAAAIAELAARVPDAPLAVCGWSFGGDVSLCVDHEAIAGWCPVAPPLAVVPPAHMVVATDPRPTHLFVPEHDQYSPPARTAEIISSWTNATMQVIDGADHFLGGSLGRVANAVVAFVDGL